MIVIIVIIKKLPRNACQFEVKLLTASCVDLSLKIQSKSWKRASILRGCKGVALKIRDAILKQLLIAEFISFFISD